MVRVKICGITNKRDAEAAVRYGADALGFIFAKSPRQISALKAKSITQDLPPYISKVGVFVNDTLLNMKRIVDECLLDTLQLHGDESEDFCERIQNKMSVALIKVFKANAIPKAAVLKKYPVNAVMIETPGMLHGGTGKTWNWSLVRRHGFKQPLITTGGLNPSNVKKAIRLTNPYAVDVSSGVEKKPGVKDHQLLKRFIQNAK